MSKQRWVECLTVAQANGPTVAGTVTTYGSLLPTQAQYWFPAGYFDYPGKALRITVGGVASTEAQTSQGFTFIANLNNVNIFTSGVCIANVAHTNCPWFLTLTLTVATTANSSTPVSTTFKGIGHLSSANALFNPSSGAIPVAIGQQPGTAVDATTANTILDFGGAWGTSNATSTIHLTHYILEALN